MARLLRSTTQSKLRPPVVVGPSRVFRPILVSYVNPVERVAPSVRHTASSRLRPPTVVAPSVVFAPVTVRVAPSPLHPRRPQPHVNYIVRPPAVVGASTVFAPVRVKTSPSRPREVLERNPWPNYRLRPPTVTAPSVVFRQVAVKLTQPPRPPFRSHWKLQPPTVTGAVTGPFAPLQVRLARWQPARRTVARLRPPAALAPSTTFRPVSVRLVTRPAIAAKQMFRLRPPAVTGAVTVTPLALPVAVRLTRSTIPRLVRYQLRSPAVVGASIVFRPVRVELAPQPTQPRAPHSRLRAPAAIASFVATPVRLALARIRPPATRSRLRQPTAVAPASVFAPVRVRQAPPIPRLARSVISKLRKPVVVLLGQIVTGRFDQPGPAGTTNSSAVESPYGPEAPGGTTGSSPSENPFDSPGPSA